MGSHAVQISSLEEALQNSELRVEWDGRVITYKSFDEVIRAINYFKGLDAAEAGPSAPRQVRVQGYSGWRRR